MFALYDNSCTFADLLRKENDFVAQLVEHNTFNVGVLGSSPSGITRNHSEMSGFVVYKGFGSMIGSKEMLSK